MQTFKEMTIRRPQAYRMPQLVLQGKWLENLGFTVGTPVSVSYQDSCLTLSTNPTATNYLSVLQVTCKLVRKRPRTRLLLDWWLLRKYGFHVGDRVVLHLMSNTIQITRVNNFTTAVIAEIT